MKATIMPKVMTHKAPRVPKLEPKGAGSRQATGGGVTKIGKVRSTEGPR